MLDVVTAGCGVVDLERDDLQGRSLPLSSSGVSAPRIGVVSETKFQNFSFKQGSVVASCGAANFMGVKETFSNGLCCPGCCGHGHEKFDRSHRTSLIVAMGDISESNETAQLAMNVPGHCVLVVGATGCQF